MELKAIMPQNKYIKFIGINLCTSYDNISNFYQSKLSYIPDYSISTKNSLNYGFGISISYEHEPNFSSNKSGWSFSLTYNKINSKNSVLSNKIFADNGKGDTIYPNSIYSYSLNIDKINFSILYDYELFNENFMLVTGPVISYFINTNLEHTISLSDKDKNISYFDDKLLKFDNSHRSISLSTGQIPNKNILLFGWQVGLKYNFKIKNFLYKCHPPCFYCEGSPEQQDAFEAGPTYLNACRELIITPSLTFNYNFNDLSSKYKLKLLSFIFSIEFKFPIGPAWSVL